MEDVLKNWLDQQCRMISGAVRALLLTGPPGKGPYDLALHWPDAGKADTRLTRVAESALHNQQAVIKHRSGQTEATGEPLDILACPLFQNGQLLGSVVIEMTHRSEAMQRVCVQKVKTGVKWLEAMLSLFGSTTEKQLINIVDLVAIGLENERFNIAATAVCNELAKRLSCKQVSLGFMRSHRVRVETTSQSTKIDHHSNLIRSLQDAMGEALDQGATIVYPAVSEDVSLTTRFHEQLSRDRQMAAVCTVPLVKDGRAVGALLLERDLDSPFDAQTIARCEQIALLLGPVLETRRRDERPLLIKILDTWKSGCASLLGPRHLPLKVAAGLIAIMLIWISLATAMLRISCDSVLEAKVCRAIVAPQQGYIAQAHVRAGDLIHDGDLLATLDDKELRLELRKWQSQRDQLLKEYRQALSASDRAEVAIIKAKRAQTEAQMRLIEQQLARTSLVAPFSGLVVKGDLSQALGSPVSPGEVLYEVAPTDDYRVVMKVDDRDIGLIAKGQRGHLKLSGIPDEAIDVTIDRLTPVAATEAGRNYFRVEAVMNRHSDLMRPGMEGITKIEISQERLIWIWTRRLVNWIRLFFWKQLP